MLKTFARSALFALFLVGCSSSGAPENSSSAVLGVPLVCEAASGLSCPAGGCSSQTPGTEYEVPVSLTIPAFSQLGRACVNSSCSDARYTPTDTRARGWTAEVVSGPGFTLPLGEIEVARDRGVFRLIQPASDGSKVWTGYCRAAGS